MRSFSVLSALAVVALWASSAEAQCCYLPVPVAPDMCNPGFYCANPAGVVYGPNYYVRPPFPPYQGVIPGPPGQAAGNYAMQQAVGNQQRAGFNGFPRHLFARSPRDFFMYDTDPMVSPYNYGYAGFGAYGRPDNCID